jgi:DNA-binding FadR family transcriptional regulator
MHGVRPAGRRAAAVSVGEYRVWVQAARAVLDRIGDGTYKPGGQLPPAWVLGAELGISKTSTQLAYRYLAGHGVICRAAVPQDGYRVCGAPLLLPQLDFGAAQAPPSAVPARLPGPGNRRPWARVAYAVRTRVGDGTYPGRIPSSGVLAAESGTTRPAALRAIRALEHHGIIVRSAGGWYAVRSTPPLRAEQEEAETR